MKHVGDKYAVKDHAGGPKVAPRAGASGARKKVPVRQIVHLVWRAVTLGAACFYVWASLRAGFTSITLLRGHIYHSMTFVPYEGHLLARFLGPSTISQSRIMDFIGHSTTPRNDTMYLESVDKVSFDGCSEVATFNSSLYGNSYLRELWLDIGADTSYKIGFFNKTELIVPVVDCSFGSIVSADDSIARVFYLVREKASPDNVYIATISISAQDYQLEDEHQYGAAGIASLTFIKDVSIKQVEYFYAARLGYPYQHKDFEPFEMIETSEEGFWVLESVPREADVEASKVIRTASRTGFFIHAESEQSNIKNLFWEQPQDPIQSMAVWQWAGSAVVRDSWAWVHGVHILFALDTLISILLLLIIVFQNLKKRKFWLGDAFISVTSTIEIRGLLVLATWYINGFWRLMEFSLMDANELASFQRLEANAFMIRADLMTLYMCVAGLLGKIFRERVDPALVVFVFQVGFHKRPDVAALLPDISRVMTDFAEYDYMKGMASVLPKYTRVSPMRLWSIHPMVERDLQFIFATLLLACGSFVFIIAYLLLRKVFRRIVPETKVVWSRLTGQSTNETDSHLSFKSNLTVFEIATGAPLQNRVGLASDYDNCIYIKGMKFASPDGIFCNGYVIVNGKFLAAASDIPAIVFIVAMKIRFKNVYVYEVHGHKVQQVARLVYPHTMSLKDLAQLNINILS